MRTIVASALLSLAAPAAAQGPANGPNWQPEQQQKAQGFATRKLTASPRHGEWTTIEAGGRTLEGWVVYPEHRDKAPVVIVLHEVFGLTDSTRNTADEIAAMGYIAITPDMMSEYDRTDHGLVRRPQSEGDFTQREDRDVYPDLEAWMDYGNRLPQANGKIAVVGLTWGGGVAFRYAVTAPRPDVKAVFVFCAAGPPVYNQGPSHNNKVLNDWPVRHTNVPVYGFYGEYDITTVTPVLLSIDDSVTAMKTAGNVFEPIVYPRAEHAFMRVGENPADPNPANAAADKASLTRLRTLLAKSFR